MGKADQSPRRRKPKTERDGHREANSERRRRYRRVAAAGDPEECGGDGPLRDPGGGCVWGSEAETRRDGQKDWEESRTRIGALGDRESRRKDPSGDDL